MKNLTPNFVLSNLDICEKVMQLATEREAAYGTKSSREQQKHGDVRFHFISLSDVVGNEEYDEKDRNLWQYLALLDYETLLFVETIMIVGRDGGDFERTYESFEKDFPESQENKRQAIEYIASKGPLHRYLSDGMRAIKNPSGAREEREEFEP